MSDVSATLTSDAFLNCILLLVLSMLGLRLLPFNLCSLKPTNLRDLWKSMSYGRAPQSRMECAISAFYHYEALSMQEIKQMQKCYAKIGRAHKRIGYELGYPAKLDHLKEVTKTNSFVTSAIARMALGDFFLELDVSALPDATSNELREVREALTHFVRDWSEEGREERAVVFKPIFEYLSRVDPALRKSCKVLVPGSGLCRLAWEINALGINSSANELSPFMNICFRFLLSSQSTHSISQYTLHPFAHWFSHQENNSNLFRNTIFPDALPRLSNTFRHLESDFLHLGPANSYDYVVTQFFIDTSYNIITTLEQIHHLLRPGGTWINLGPLLWRSGAQAALELSLDEVLSLAEKIGFDIDEGSRKTIECEYTADRRALMRWVYKAEFWVARKRSSSVAT